MIRFGRTRDAGVTLSEVMVAMVLTSLGVTGAMGAFAAANKGLAHDALAARALAMAESRVEAKRSVPWNQLLSDDLDHDGVTDVIMRDDGTGGDRTASDGIYSAMLEQHGVRVVWTVAPRGLEPLGSAAVVIIEARSFFGSGAGERVVHLATLRANSAFSGTY